MAGPISIHALLAESDICVIELIQRGFVFLSTLSLRRATPSKLAKTSRTENISIHALLAESDLFSCFWCILNLYISIHALLAESDREPTALRTPHQRFLSTLSLRRATTHPVGVLVRVIISIHALLAESDRFQAADISARRISIHALLAESDKNGPRPSTGIHDFYPRSPCGERLMLAGLWVLSTLFLSTLSLRRATR